ncbi:DUF4085 family protein [Metasolibacillus meyeri]|uniref:DUF4085 family protein n=1 Tax=Metasolibacillus meyeri TaxID=1071052 RepID=UPI000D326312|nr:DUF4085 family protein [Metasolibacillus meyeri]
MFFLTSKRQEIFDVAHTYPFGEEIDAEFEEYLYENLTKYSNIVPHEFHAEIMERTLFQNNDLMEKFRDWCNVTIEQFTTKRNAIYEKREAIVEHFDLSAQAMFLKSFHDGEILDARQQGNQFTLLLDMSGGFTTEAIVQLIFHDAQIEGELEGYYVYDELVETEDGFALRVLSSFGSPYAEWTIYFKNVTANYLYRPAVYIEPENIATWDDYVAALNRDDKYYIIKNSNFVEIDLTNLLQKDEGVFAGELLLGKIFNDAREQIYCATYEDPYAHFSEPIPIDELQDAMFDSDKTIQTRAFNTIFALGGDVANIVNDVLRKVDLSSEEDMYFSIMASHFEQLGCLEDDVRRKWIKE